MATTGHHRTGRTHHSGGAHTATCGGRVRGPRRSSGAEREQTSTPTRGTNSVAHPRAVRGRVVGPARGVLTTATGVKHRTGVGTNTCSPTATCGDGFVGPRRPVRTTATGVKHPTRATERGPCTDPAAVCGGTAFRRPRRAVRRTATRASQHGRVLTNTCRETGALGRWGDLRCRGPRWSTLANERPKPTSKHATSA